MDGRIKGRGNYEYRSHGAIAGENIAQSEDDTEEQYPTANRANSRMITQPTGPALKDVASGLDMSLRDAMETQRAVRRVRLDPVDDEIVLRLIELALKAPTGSNLQNWHWIVVKDPATKARLAARYRQAKAVYSRLIQRSDRKLAKDQLDKTLRTRAAEAWQVDHFQEIPVIVVACLKGSRPRFGPMLVSSYYGSIYPAVQNLLLAARAVGLGATLVTLPLWSTASARHILGLPRDVTPCAMVPLGWPVGQYGPTTRKPVSEVVHLNRYGNRAWR